MLVLWLMIVASFVAVAIVHGTEPLLAISLGMLIAIAAFVASGAPQWRAATTTTGLAAAPRVPTCTSPRHAVTRVPHDDLVYTLLVGANRITLEEVWASGAKRMALRDALVRAMGASASRGAAELHLGVRVRTYGLKNGAIVLMNGAEVGDALDVPTIDVLVVGGAHMQYHGRFSFEPSMPVLTRHDLMRHALESSVRVWVVDGDFLKLHEAFGGASRGALDVQRLVDGTYAPLVPCGGSA